jgi:hypothetical protein
VHVCWDLNECPLAHNGAGDDEYETCALSGVSRVSTAAPDVSSVVFASTPTTTEMAPRDDAGREQWERLRTRATCTSLAHGLSDDSEYPTTNPRRRVNSVDAPLVLSSDMRHSLTTAPSGALVVETSAVNDDAMSTRDRSDQARAHDTMDRVLAAIAERMINAESVRTRLQTVGRRSIQQRTAKEVADVVADARASGGYVAVPTLVGLLAKRASDMACAIQRSFVPDVVRLRDWVTARCFYLWTRFAPLLEGTSHVSARRRGRQGPMGATREPSSLSPNQYTWTNHCLAVLYISSTGMRWETDNERWAVPPLPGRATA